MILYVFVNAHDVTMNLRDVTAHSSMSERKHFLETISCVSRVLSFVHSYITAKEMNAFLLQRYRFAHAFCLAQL